MTRLPYFATCASLPLPHHQAVRALNEFDDSAREITFSTFAKNTQWQDWARTAGYAIGPAPGLLHLRDDWAVRYLTGRFLGRRAYVCMWSAYHIIFCEVTP